MSQYLLMTYIYKRIVSVFKTLSRVSHLLRSQEVDLTYFIFLPYFYFSFQFLEQLGLGLISHAVISVTI